MAAAFAVVVLLGAQPSLAFRSGGDLPDLDGQKRVSFASSTISLELFGTIAPTLDLAGVEADLKQAAATWSAPGCTNLTISYAGTSQTPAAPGDGHNTVQWVSDWKARGFPKTSPGLTDVQYEKDANGHWTIVEADTYLDLDYDWTAGVPLDSRRSVVAVLTHELGHALGLLHPCEINGAGGAPKCSASTAYALEEMYPIYTPTQTTLSSDDVAGVCFLYSPACDDSSCADGDKCVGGVCKPLCGADVCESGMECKDAQCVSTSKVCGPTGCVGQPCTTQADCAVKEYCAGGVCARGEGALADVCTAASECFDGACANGVCAESCTPGAECQSGGSCDPTTNVCADDLAPMGAACKFSTDCRGGYCLAEAGRAPVCSRSCDKGQPPCPSGWECRTADDQPVCAPAFKPDQGCSVVSSAAHRPFSPRLPGGLALGTLSVVCLRKLRRRQLRRSIQ